MDKHARNAWWIAGGGTLVAGGGMALLAGLAGGDGREGMRFFLLGTLLACSLGAVVAIGTGAVDAIRGRTVGRSRVAAAIVLVALVIVLPGMLVGIGG